MEAGTAWIPDDVDFGSRLAAVRHRMGWNIKEAARECGIPAATWRLWEDGGSEPRNRVTVSMAIAQRADCDYLWLVHGPARGVIRVAEPTVEYAPGIRVIAVGGENRRRGGLSTTRAVTQTRPIRRQTHPFTPVAV